MQVKTNTLHKQALFGNAFRKAGKMFGLVKDEEEYIRKPINMAKNMTIASKGATQRLPKVQSIHKGLSSVYRQKTPAMDKFAA